MRALSRHVAFDVTDWISPKKGVIEKSAVEGQKATHSALDAAIRKHIDAHKDEYLTADTAALDASQADGQPNKPGAGPTAAAAATATTSNVPGGQLGVLSGIIDTIGGPVVASLLLIIVLLALTNWLTWRSLESYKAGSVVGVKKETEDVRKLIEVLEKRLGGLKGKMEALGRSSTV